MKSLPSGTPRKKTPNEHCTLHENEIAEAIPVPSNLRIERSTGRESQAEIEGRTRREKDLWYKREERKERRSERKLLPPKRAGVYAKEMPAVPPPLRLRCCNWYLRRGGGTVPLLRSLPAASVLPNSLLRSCPFLSPISLFCL